MRSNMYSNQHYGDRHAIGASTAKRQYNGLIASELTNNITRAQINTLFAEWCFIRDTLHFFYIAFHHSMLFRVLTLRFHENCNEIAVFNLHLQE